MTALIFGNVSYYMFSRPVLSILLTMPSAFQEYKQSLLGSQPAEQRAKLEAEFTSLESAVRHNLDAGSRDKFVQRMNVFRQRVRTFIAV
mmetsp:Transcript_464/g.1301  ORF Transcript_464/g.1301 Transcript_464/m.1301 type:complete len:89 (+) Transcript_464:3-269(+)